ncbi:MAG TPA: hypothetical protein VN374_05185 [Desulfitobacteriaceae bacterium]|nr:hypothetical protein [Desulfitobacteriaceae bacterium]
MYNVEAVLGSQFLCPFLRGNLVSLLIALLAINATSLGIVLTKIRDIMDRQGVSKGFEKTQAVMLFSIKEQIVLIFVSVILLMLDGSKLIVGYDQVMVFVRVGVITCFVYAMMVLYDTAKSIFIVLK